MAGLIILAGGVIHMNPRGGPTAWPVRALHVNTSHIFVPMIPAMIAAVIASAMQLPRLSVEMDMQRALRGARKPCGTATLHIQST